MIDVPKSFNLAGRKWCVYFLDQDAAEKQYGGHHDDLDASGLSSSRQAELYIVDRDDEAEEYRRITFWHELVHGMLSTLGRHESTHDEVLVDGLAYMLNEFDKTRRGKTNLD